MAGFVTARTRLVPLALAGLLAAGCLYRFSTLEECFYRFGKTERLQMARELSPELQLRLYLHGVSSRRPKDTSLSRVMARGERWRELSPLIVEKLEKPSGPLEPGHLIRLVGDLTAQGLDFRGEVELLEALDRAVETRKVSAAERRKLQEMIGRIRQGPSVAM